MMCRGWLLAWVLGCVGLLVIGCSSGSSGSAGSASSSEAGGGGDPKSTLVDALKKMDGLDTYQAELSMPGMDVGPGIQMTTKSHIEASVKDDVIYQVTEVSGGPTGTSKQENLIRGSEFLMRSDLFGTAFGASPDTWFRAPAAGQGNAMIVSMLFAPAAQAITEVSDQGTAAGGDVTVYRATLDPSKFRSALSSANVPGGIPTDKIPAPGTIDYGVGTDGYVHTIAFTMGDGAPQTTIDVHDYNSTLNLPNPTDIRDMPTG